ncbi:MAG: hypothetical protein JW757_11130 [Anaerolineales bacterium]|nr:hypothetical protein [Anaerolineales bacterium]
MKNKFLPVFLAGMWVGLSEFVRNELLLKSHWVSHDQQLGLIFPSSPVNAIIWVIWSFVFVGLIFVLLQKFSSMQTTLLAWVFGFFMMWLVVWNLDVLPLSILPLAVPLSILETFLAAYICKALPRAKTA